MIEILNDSNFQAQVIDSKKVCIIDFYASWCMPCKMQAPIFDKLCQEFGDKINFFKLDVDLNPSVCDKLSIASIPTLIMYKNGELVYKLVGLTQEEELREKLLELI